MNNLRKISLIIILLLSLALSTSCGRASERKEKAAPSATDEGADTQCEITGYSPYAGDNSSLFLSAGDRIAVISPSALPSQKQVDAVEEGLKRWGYVPVLGEHVCEESRSLSDCMDDLQWALSDPDIKAIFCVRGGYGASEVMDRLEMDLISRSEKLIIGYSDISIYISAWTVAGLPSVHASMSAAFTDLPEECAAAEENLLKGQIPSYKCEADSYCRQGKAEGILIGGNLSTFTATIGTAYDSTVTDQPYILFLEEVGEDMQHIHRFLTILKHQGVLDRAEGIIFGEWTDLPADTGDYGGDSRGGKFSSVADMISRVIIDDIDVPVAFGFPAGHGDVNYPLMMGEQVTLDVSDGSYTIEWFK